MSVTHEHQPTARARARTHTHTHIPSPTCCPQCAYPLAALLQPPLLLADPAAAQQLALRLGLDATHQMAAIKASQILGNMLAMAKALHPDAAAAAAAGRTRSLVHAFIS